MAMRGDESYNLLQSQEENESNETLSHFQIPLPDREHGMSLVRKSIARTTNTNRVTLLIMSAAGNVLLVALLAIFFYNSRFQSQDIVHTELSDISPYGKTPNTQISKGEGNTVSTDAVIAGLGPNASVHFPYSTGYGPEVTNHSLLDERWEAIDINPGVVAISDEWATEHNLAPTQRFPWDASKGVYWVTAFHTLHRLVRPFRSP